MNTPLRHSGFAGRAGQDDRPAIERLADEVAALKAHVVAMDALIAEVEAQYGTPSEETALEAVSRDAAKRLPPEGAKP